ncbi:glycosyltransferase family 1 protein [uncultured Brevundimonas sp.]|uniref:glycosyltransferase family 4 protein n=1 Tax=uncultured Brevundimonas sp. TaxID=213418 RepID=UPI00262320B3|nr:glycosyltransferase family 1 protein [uncultured Brevundimonas sp.]
MRRIFKKVRRHLEIQAEPKWLEQLKIFTSRKKIQNWRARYTAGHRNLFIDITVIAANDAGTGIQRVVRGIAAQADIFEQHGWNVQFVAASRAHPYHRISWPVKRAVADKTPIQGGAGDVFLGLDYSLDAVRFHEGQIRSLASSGVRIAFLIHDLLPIDRPEWFPPQTGNRFRKWLRILASLSDLVLCNSSQTEKDFKAALATHFKITTPCETNVIPMGTDVSGSMHSLGTSEDFMSWLGNLPHQTFLTVSTLEPRKGHSDLLEAFSRLWELGHDYNLVLVGRSGWKVDDLVLKLTQHPEYNKRLHWKSDLSDEELIHIYERCKGLIFPSLAEGYGLPLVEALNHQKPVLARDIEVFRDHEACGVRYFPENATPEVFADHINEWADMIDRGEITIVRPSSRTWRHSAEYVAQLLDELAPDSPTPL